MIDLHVHSTKSDGTFSPKELVDYAMQKNISAFALTDHDTIDGLDEIIDYANLLREKNVKNVPEIIPGIEFSTEFEGKDIHIVGLYINHKAECFKEYLKDFVDSRDNRNKKMCDLLCENGFDISYSELKEKYPEAILTRAHIAMLMIEKGYVNSRIEAFDRYIGDRAPYFIPREKVTPDMAIDLILKADGIPVLAHPILYHLSDRRLEAMVSRLKDIGLMGIEALYSTYTSSEENQIRSLANKYHLLLSGGSDFHGAVKPKIDLGTGYGKLYIHEDILKRIKLSRKNLLFTDMDGTLLLNDSSISEEMTKAIEKMTNCGHQFVLTSGRPLPSILEVKVKFGLNFDNMWVISNNGGLIYNCKTNEIVRNIKLSSDVIKCVEDIANSNNIHIHSYTDNEIVGYEEDEELIYYKRRIHMPFIKSRSISGFLKDGSFKIQLIHLTNKNELTRVKEEIENKLGDKVDVFFSNEQYLEILPKGVNKGEAILFLTKYLAMPHSHTYAAGDAENDIPMLEASAHGIAMANATDIVKEKAEIITEKSNNENGLIEIIDKFFQ